jgi:hypothetical protein
MIISIRTIYWTDYPPPIIITVEEGKDGPDFVLAIPSQRPPKG